MELVLLFFYGVLTQGVTPQRLVHRQAGKRITIYARGKRGHTLSRITPHLLGHSISYNGVPTKWRRG